MPLPRTTGVVVTGGGAHLPGAAADLADALNLPVHVAPEPELGVIRGTAAWARAALGRRSSPSQDRP